MNDNLFDTNAVWWVAGTAAGAVLGYLIGRTLDKRAEKTVSAEMKQILEEALRLRDAEFVRTLAKSQPITGIQPAER